LPPDLTFKSSNASNSISGETSLQKLLLDFRGSTATGRNEREEGRKWEWRQKKGKRKKMGGD